jgi:hypothetical protein
VKYQAPYGVSDPNASYINGNPAAGIQGSIPPAAVFEEPQREMINFIQMSGFAPSGGAMGVAGGDLTQLAKSAQAQRVNFSQDTGAQNAMVVAMTPPLVAGGTYPLGLPVRMKVLHSNINDVTHTALTLDAGCGPQNVKRVDGAMPASNDLLAGGLYEFVWDGTNWQIINFIAGGAGGGATYYIKIPYAADTSPVANQIVAAFSPAITAPAVGDLILVKVANTVSAATTIAVNAIAAKPVVRNDGQNSDILQNDMFAGGFYLFQWDGADWALLNPAFGILFPSGAPFYPEILVNDGIFSMASGSATVTIVSPALWLHRGMRLFSIPSNVVLNTAASKTYHLRWDAPGTGQATPIGLYPNGRFILRDLADPLYNPASLNELDYSFDCTYDSMLCAKVVTNAANTPTITALLNKARLMYEPKRLSVGVGTAPAGPPVDTWTINWSRAPTEVSVISTTSEVGAGAPGWPVGDPGTDEPIEGFFMSSGWGPANYPYRNRNYFYALVYAEANIYYMNCIYHASVKA